MGGQGLDPLIVSHTGTLEDLRHELAAVPGTTVLRRLGARRAVIVAPAGSRSRIRALACVIALEDDVRQHPLGGPSFHPSNDK